MNAMMTIDRPLVILTGGIACGKSSVASYLQKKGIEVVDTDAIAHQLTAPGGSALPMLRDHFGDIVFNTDGSLNRAALRDLVFSDPSHKADLETILHPMIRRHCLEALSRAQSLYVVADIPLFAETGFLRAQADRVLVVDCLPETQKQRLLARSSQNGITEELADLMLQAQAPREARLALATEIIDNNGSPEKRNQQVDTIHQTYLNLGTKNPHKNPVNL